MRALVPLRIREITRRTVNAARRWRPGGVVVCRVRGLNIRLQTASAAEHFRAATYASKEPETLEWLDEELRERDVFMDVGANVGLYSLYAALKEPRCRVFAFEPESQNFASLCRNIMLNQASNVLPCCIPLDETSRFDRLHVATFEAGAALHAFGSMSLGGESVLQQGALSSSLNDLVGVHGLPPPTLLKIDVDGIEDRILAGADDLLRSGVVRSMLVELNSEGSREPIALEILNSAGYRLVHQSAWSARFGSVTSRNYLFRRDDLVAASVIAQ